MPQFKAINRECQINAVDSNCTYGCFLNYSISKKLQKSTSLLPIIYKLTPFLTNISILCPLKTPEKQRFSGVFRGYEPGTLVRDD